ncbi:MAG: HDIG domain-containing protein [Chloroflexi bacterium]|nr:MAG: HDIG domain-containing protein [Chloroflexota bacterium]
MLGPIWNTALQAQRLWDAFRKTSLVWLLDPCHPLLRKLRTKAPGTYHHSLVVGSLSESAALRIGADARLVRVGALYHDIGKTRRPAMFGENGLPTPHDRLDPLTSAQYIIRHVADGLAMARAHNLPDAVLELIAQHHGTSLVGYFHEKAKAAGQSLPESLFRYPGPRPQSPEAGIVMLADIVEAAVRATQPTQHEEIAAVVTRLVEERWTQGELAESGLTWTDLRHIKAAFQQSLQGVYHSRIAYPVREERPTMTRRQKRWAAERGFVPDPLGQAMATV